MRRSTLVLLAVCIGLAAALGYVVRGLQDERSRSGEQTAELTELRAQLVAADQPRAAPEPPKPAMPPDEPAPAAETPAPEPRTVPGEARIDDLAKSEDEARALRGMQANQAAVAKSLADPIARAKLLVDTRDEIRRTSPDLGRALDLKAPQEARLIDLLAEQQLQMKAPAADHRQLFERHESELRALLGAGKMAQFRQYRASAPERAQVQALRARLGESNALSDEKATQLIALMHEEREKYVASFTNSGAGGHLPDYPFTPFSSGDDPVEEVRFAEAQLPRTEEFLQRLQGQAATLLTREQLRRYAEMQDQQLAGERSRLEWLRKKAAEAG